MLLNIGNLTFPIPYSKITRQEKDFVLKIYECQRDNAHYIGENKMSTHQTAILLSYFIALLHQSSQTFQIIYLTQTQDKKCQLLQLSQKIRSNIERYLQSINKYQSQSMQMEQNHRVRIVEGKFEQLQDVKGKQQKILNKRLIITTIQRYLSVKLKRREDTVWRKMHDFHYEQQRREGYWNKTDILYLETNDMEGIIDLVLHLQISETILKRAAIEHKKLDKYYNFRKEGHKNNDNQEPRVQSSEQTNTNEWNIQKLDKKLNELYRNKKQALRSTNNNRYDSNQRLALEYQQCYYLMNLQTIGYLLAHLQNEWKQLRFDRTVQSTDKFLQHLYSKTMLNTNVIKRMKKLLLALVKKYPPKINNQITLTYEYLEVICNFFQKLALWTELFSSFCIIRENVREVCDIRLKTFNQKLLFDLLLEDTKTISIIQNLALRFNYYEDLFRPRDLNIKIQYKCPLSMSEHYKHVINGLIVTSTPNEQDLKIINDRDKSENSSSDKKDDHQHYNQIIRSYGVLIHDICELTPDGVVVYFPSPEILKDCRNQWQRNENIFKRINKDKNIFEESEWEHQNKNNFINFKKQCKMGRGAIYFLSAHSNFAKHQTFYGYLSRCIIFIGVPYNLHALELRQKMIHLKIKQTQKQHYRFEEALRHVNRCLNNCINSNSQMKTVIFADLAYNRTQIKKKWFPFVSEGNLNTLQVLDNIIKINKSITSTFLKKNMHELQLEADKVRSEEYINIEKRKSEVDLDLRKSTLSIQFKETEKENYRQKLKSIDIHKITSKQQ